MAPRTWQSLSTRQQGLRQEALHAEVPDHLEMPLRAWIHRALSGGGAELVAIRLEIAIDYWSANGEGRKFLAFASQQYDLLDIVDAILGAGGPWPKGYPRTFAGHDVRDKLLAELAVMLDEGRSAYQINDAGDGLAERVPAESAAAMQAAMTAAEQAPNAGSAADLLKIAWHTAFALHPDSSKAYGHAIKSVEAAGAAVVEPNNPKATLGTMIRRLRDHPQDYALAIPGPSGTGDVAPLTGMMDLLWKGQTSRHGAQTATRMETPEEAQMAVVLAVTLVHWFTTGAVRRNP